ncbi:MAG: ectonucleotide pyrophosphatase/phosphodiesterase [Acidobacteriota bacterium]|nr:ectonucleotide pyrophosphatase/phosphodiesterase [Acidobacteriota bacterium]
MRYLLAALAFSATLAAQSSHKLLVISIDGLDARFLNDPALKVKVPNIRRLMKSGASATVIGVAPSETWPSHASLVTGVSPWQHGIVANKAPDNPGDRFFSASAFKTPTLWDAVTAAGMKAATIYWPVTLGAKDAFNFPEYWETRKGNAIALDAIAQKSAPAGLADRIEKVYPSFEKQLWDDSSSANAAAYLLSVEKPDLLLVHLAEVDAEQHDTGALSIYAREMLENDDEMIGQMLAKAPSGMIVAILSDHGFENSNYLVRPKILLKQAGIKGRVEVADGLIGTSDPAVAAHLKQLIGQGRKSGIARQVPMAEVRAKAPALGRWTAAFDTLQNFVASDEDHGPAVGPGTHLGVHGLWPSRPNYRAVFILSGEGVRTVKLGEIDMLQIAPTLAEILAVKLPAAKSTSLWHSVTR